MPKQATGLQRIRGEWVSYTLNFKILPPDWSEIEASQHPHPWLDRNPHLYALRRMAIMAEASAIKLLLSLSGPDTDKERQILAKIGQDRVADKTAEAVRVALAYLTVNPPKTGKQQTFCHHPGDPFTSSDEEDL